MNTREPTARRALCTPWALAALFGLPLVIAFFTYYGSDCARGRVNPAS